MMKNYEKPNILQDICKTEKSDINCRFISVKSSRVRGSLIPLGLASTNSFLVRKLQRVNFAKIKYFITVASRKMLFFRVFH